MNGMIGKHNTGIDVGGCDSCCLVKNRAAYLVFGFVLSDMYSHRT